MENEQKQTTQNNQKITPRKESTQKVVPFTNDPQPQRKPTNEKEEENHIEIDIESVKQNQNDDLLKPSKNQQKNTIKRDFFDNLAIIIQFTSMLFPTIFGLLDFFLDINYVFIEGNFENQAIKHVAYFSFGLAPLISLAAWLLLFTIDIRQKKCEKFQFYQKKYNTATIQNSNFLRNRFMLYAYLHQFGYQLYHMCYYLPKGLFYTILQQLKVLVIYIYTFTGYKPTFLITDTVLKEFEKNSKILKNNHKLYLQNLQIRKQNQKKQQNNKKEKEKYDTAQQEIKKLQGNKFIGKEQQQQRIQKCMYIPKYIKTQEEHKMTPFPTSSKQVILESGIYNQKGQKSNFNKVSSIEFMQSFSNDSVLQSFLLIGDLIESAFESLPMLILQFVNNSLTGWQLMDKISFTSSVIMVVYSLIRIVSMLFDYKLNAAFEVFTLLTENPQKSQKDEKETLSLKEWIINSQQNNSKEKEENQAILNESTGWFTGKYSDSKELLIGEIEELEIVSKWKQKQFDQYDQISFDFSNQQDTITLFTINKFINMFAVISDNVSQRNTISFNFYQTPLTPEDKLEIYEYFEQAQLSGYLFQEQCETVPMEEKIMTQILNQFNNNSNNKMRNLKIVFNEQHAIEFSGIQEIESYIQKEFFEFLGQNLPYITHNLELENFILSEQNKSYLFNNISELPQQLKNISLNFETLSEKDLHLFTTLPNLEKLKLIQKSGQLENLNEFIKNTPKLQNLELNMQNNKINNIEDFSLNLLTNKNNLTNINLDFSQNQISHITNLGQQLSNNNNVEYLNINLDSNQINGIETIGKGLSTNNKLIHLRMNLDSNKITDINDLSEGISTNTCLQHFQINLQKNDINNIENLQEALAKNNNLVHFNLNLNYNQINNIEKLGETFTNNSKLEYFQLDLQKNDIQNIDNLGVGLGKNKNIKHFSMNLNYNQISNIDNLGDGLGKNKHLLHFHMDIFQNQISNIDKLGEGLGLNTQLQHLSMYLSVNQIKNIDKLGEGLKNNNNLKHFSMNLYDNQITNIDKLGEAIGNNNTLKHIDMYLNTNQITNIDIISHGIANNNNLEYLDLNLNDNQITSIDSLGEGFISNNSLIDFNMKLNQNQIQNVEKVAEGLSSNNKLKNFYMELKRNDITNIGNICKHLEKNQNLDKFHMNLQGIQIDQEQKQICEQFCNNKNKIKNNDFKIEL